MSNTGKQQFTADQSIYMYQLLDKDFSVPDDIDLWRSVWTRLYCYFINKEGKDQESIQLSTTPDPGYQWEIYNFTIRHHKLEPRGQPYSSRWPNGINKQTRTKA